MPFNLLHESWIPVRRKSGVISWIAPHQIAERDDPPVAIASPRPDFDGALIQFLIGLMQTTAAPKGAMEWEDRFEKPHAPEILRELFATVEAAFNLDGEGPRFMQDLTLSAAEAVSVPIGGLLIERMGEEGLADGGDLFAKPNLYPALGLGAVAAALFGLQTNAPSGGRGHRTSLRGGGPLCTLVQGESLFETVWLNVLIDGDFLSRFGNKDLTALDARFPWMAPTRTSDMKAGGRFTTPEDIHPAQYFWAMPRRIRLQFMNGQTGSCALSGSNDVPVVASYITRHSGVKYQGELRHPLTAYSVAKPGEPLNPKKGSSDGLPYREWPNFIAGDSKHEPARVIQAFHSERRFHVAKHVRLWAFGYDMNNMKPCAWHQGTTPLVSIDPEHQDAFRALVQGLVEASESVRRTLLQKVKEAISRRPKDLKGDLGATLNPAFWARTEAAFFEAAIALRDALPKGSPAPDIAERWLAALHQAAMALFETYSQMLGEFSATDVHRVAAAWNHLRHYTSPTSFELRKAVGLPVPETDQPKAKRGKRKKDVVTP